MNKVILLGRLTKNPEIKYSQKGNMMVANFTLAVNRKYVKQVEERQTDFINIVAFSKLAEFVNQYLNIGLQICVSGRIQTSEWEDKNGQKRYTPEVIAEEIDFADSLKKKEADESILNGNSPINNSNTQIENNDNSNDFVLDADDLPF